MYSNSLRIYVPVFNSDFVGCLGQNLQLHVFYTNVGSYLFFFYDRDLKVFYGVKREMPLWDKTPVTVLSVKDYYDVSNYFQ